MFDKFPLKTIKEIVREYELTTHISFSRLVDGKRKPYTKKELANELHKHLEIKKNGEIILKKHSLSNPKTAKAKTAKTKIPKPKTPKPKTPKPKTAKTKTPKPKKKKATKKTKNVEPIIEEEEMPDVEEEMPDVEEEIPDVEEEIPDVEEEIPDVEEEIPDVDEEYINPKIINEADDFFIFDPTSIKNLEYINLTAQYKLDGVVVINNYEDLTDIVGEQGVEYREFKRTPRDVEVFKQYLLDMKKENPIIYNKVFQTTKNINSNTLDHLYVYILRDNEIVGFVKTVIDGAILQVDMLYISPHDIGKGYVGELLNILFRYIAYYKKIKTIRTAELRLRN